MSDQPAMTAETEIGVDPSTAFKAFTEEMDRWWLPGPINYFDSARARGKRCESGVGGRLIEIYDEGTGEGLELGKITVWEPGHRLVWASSVDDVEMTVRFLPSERGTQVVVEARLPDGGRNAGGASWVKVAPTWFSNWCSRRDELATPPQSRPGAWELSRLGLSISYRRPATCARWIRDVVALEPTLPVPDDDEGDQQWIEFRAGDGLLVVFKATDSSGDRSPVAHVPWIFVDDLDDHHARAVERGAEIVEGIHQHGYRAYTLRDPEGHLWTITQTLPAMHHPGSH